MPKTITWKQIWHNDLCTTYAYTCYREGEIIQRILLSPSIHSPYLLIVEYCRFLIFTNGFKLIAYTICLPIFAIIDVLLKFWPHYRNYLTNWCWRFFFWTSILLRPCDLKADIFTVVSITHLMIDTRRCLLMCSDSYFTEEKADCDLILYTLYLYV